MQQNQGIIRGKLKGGALEFDYERDGETFYKGILEVHRLSQVCDEIRVVIPGRFTKEGYSWDDEITLRGSFRSRNELIDGKSTLQLYFFVSSVSEEVPNPCNILFMEGFICKPPVYRLTPFNKEVCDILIAVNRLQKRTDYIPCIVWGKNAHWAKNLKVGDLVEIEGRIQSRRYTKAGDLKPNTRTAYEVSVSRISLI